MSDDYNPWYSAEWKGWKGAAGLAAMLWCLGSGMYTLALVVRSLIG